ncbi:glycoside hydrolase family 6 protein [Streptomyces sp. TRM66268-LWL]|uniref:Glucanase n=1 Tax=Streptomyces polyasparticus TaxID=2767826 RepID=A0ABR7SQF3_9ACTN|nr:glycoside hydrolase family 6 protein [Streptomyces polyasparticus]MBC9717069.1 glycoside hydrolase family 6 protein [Streptomyces polyasparticus]
MYRSSATFRGAVKTGVAFVGAALLLTGCSSDGDKDPDNPSSSAKQQPKDKDPYWVNPDTNAAKQLQTYTEESKKSDAELIRKIAEQPTGEWLVPEKAQDQARDVTEAAEQADREAVLVLYNIPHRDCDQYSGGGAADGDAYRAFIDEVAKGIEDRKATVILEPDALLHVVDGCTPPEFHEERYDLLKGAIDKLHTLKNTKVYIDGGNPGSSGPDAFYDPLKRAGIDKADGFAVNVSNYFTTQESIEFGKQLSDKVGAKPFVIDTSRNGNGVWQSDDKEAWCNPPGRALGEAPTVDTADERVDAYLWIKRPGESDGECRGGPKAGEWWPEYALELAKNAK